MQASNNIQISRFTPADQQGVIDVIVPIQREEFGIVHRTTERAVEAQTKLQAKL